jgi:hypothetical protein
MATYNPLHQYRSYQYHFILIATDKMNNLVGFDSNTEGNLDRYKHPENDKYGAKEFGGFKYSVIYNSMQDANFYIDNLELSHINGSASAAGVSESVQTQKMSMVVKEPYTADFITAMHVAYQNVSTSPNVPKSLMIQNMRFGLKIIFTGYVDDNKANEPNIITNINLLTFSISTLDMALSKDGATYNITCMPMINSAAYRSPTTNFGGMKVTVKKKLSDAVKKIQDTINDNMKKKYEEDKKNAPDENRPLLEYKILLDPIYEGDEYVLNQFARDQHDGDDDSTVNFTTTDSDTLTMSLEHLMNMSQKVAKETEIKDGVRYTHRIISGGPYYSKDGKVERYVYLIYRQKLSHQDLVDTGDSKTVTFPLSYDYLYTGKNYDIITFDMRIKGMATSKELITVINPTSYSGDNKTTVDASKTVSDSKKKDASKLVTGDNEEVLTSTFNDDASNAKPLTRIDPQRQGMGALAPETLYSGRKAISAALIGSMNDNLVIRLVGNPALLQNFVPDSGMFVDSAGEVKSATEVIKMFGASETNHFSSYPSMNINVRIPKPSYLQGASSGGIDNYYSSPFFDDRYYYIKDTISKFSHGVFEQSMDLMVISKEEAVPVISTKKIGDKKSDATNPAQDKDPYSANNQVANSSFFGSGGAAKNPNSIW